MQKLRNLCFYGTIFILIFGTMFHYAYDWLGSRSWVGIFAPVNESTWEHLKMLFWPGFLWMIYEYFIAGKHFPNYVVGKAIGLLLGILLIVSGFYTYTGIVGRHYPLIDIILFIVSVILSKTAGCRIMMSGYQFPGPVRILSLIGLVILAVLFTVFTFYPPQIPLFLDPLANRYGR